MIKVNGREVEFIKFPNGETCFNHELLKKSINNDMIIPEKIVFKYEDDSDIYKLFIVKKYIDGLLPTLRFNITLDIYYLPYSRMDRSEDGSPFTLKYFADIINEMQFAKVRIVEPHSDVSLALINNSTPYYVNFDLIERVILNTGFSIHDDFIVFPDAGAMKRYSKMKVPNTLVANKVRDFETGQIKSIAIQTNPLVDYEGRTALIVDDLTSFGGTFIGVAKKLRKLGFNKVYLLVAHSEYSVLVGQLFNHIDKLFTTNTILNKSYETDNMKIYDIEEMF